MFQSEMELNEITLTEKAILIYKNLVEELEKEINTLRGLVTGIKEENIKLRKELNLLIIENKLLSAQLVTLRKENNRLLKKAK